MIGASWRALISISSGARISVLGAGKRMLVSTSISTMSWREYSGTRRAGPRYSQLRSGQPKQARMTGTESTSNQGTGNFSIWIRAIENKRCIITFG